MTLKTVAVTCRAAEQGGQPVARALYRATLDRTELDAGFVAPETTEATAEEDGVAVLRLWPNALGAAASSYRVRAWLPDGTKFLDVRAVVPDADCRLDEIVMQAPYPPIDAAEQALRTAQGALFMATEQAGAASASAAAAAESRRLAGLDAEATASDRAIAVGAAGAATGKADEAGRSAALAGASAQGAAGAVYEQLAAIKQQTEAARDAALAGLGAADNSQVLAELLGAIGYAADMAGQAVREIARVDAGVKQYDSPIEAIAYALTSALDLAGVTARAVSGGEVVLGAGAAAMPSLSAVGDRDTGAFFPAANSLALVTGALERLRITADGRVGVGTTAPSGLLDVNDNKIRVRIAQTPASAAAAGNPGELAWDVGYVYVCVAANTWKRAPLLTW